MERPNEIQMVKTCVDLGKRLDFTCCNSCHADADEYDYDLVSLVFEGEEYEVCCAWAAAVDIDRIARAAQAPM